MRFHQGTARYRPIRGQLLVWTQQADQADRALASATLAQAPRDTKTTSQSSWHSNSPRRPAKCVCVQGGGTSLHVPVVMRLVAVASKLHLAKKPRDENQ